MNINRLLYEWLKRTDRNEWSSALRLTDTDVPFEQWWEENEEDLTDHKKSQWCFEEIRSAKEYEQHTYPDDERELCVFINMWNTKEALIEGFKQLLKERHPGTVGRPKFEAYSEFEWCEVSGELTVRTLEIMLTVYDLRQRKVWIDGSEKTKGHWRYTYKLWQIGEILNMNPNQITLPDDPPKVLVSKKAVMNATVSRYVRWAETLKTNLCLGRFPKYK